MLLAPHDNAIMSARRREGDSRIAGTKGTVCDGRLGRDGYVVDKTYLSDLFSLLDRYDLVVPHDWQVAWPVLGLNLLAGHGVQSLSCTPSGSGRYVPFGQGMGVPDWMGQ